MAYYFGSTKMSKSLARILTRVTTALIVLSASLLTDISNSAALTGSCADPVLGTKTPILLVHGLNAGPSVWGSKSDATSMDGALSRLPNVDVETFSYKSVSQSWVSDQQIGPSLATRIICLADESKAGHGIGKVVVVAHSMGGLAARYAATKTKDATAVSHDLALVVTIATPNLGSGWANVAESFIQNLCSFDEPSQPAPNPGSICGLTAYTGLQIGSLQLAELPMLSKDIPVEAIAGDVTLTMPLFFATVRMNSESDLVVGAGSALQGIEGISAGGGQATVSCDMNLDTLAPLLFLPPLDAASLLLAHPTLPSCWHGGLPNNPQVIQATIKAIEKNLASTATLSPSPSPSTQPASPCLSRSEFLSRVTQLYNNGTLPAVTGGTLSLMTGASTTCADGWEVGWITLMLQGGGTSNAAALLRWQNGQWSYVMVGSGFLGNPICDEVPLAIRAALRTC